MGLEQLMKYILETLEYIEIVRNFCDGEEEWTGLRQNDINEMRDAKNRAEKFTGRFKKQTLQKKLDVVLERILDGLKTLQDFLDAVEKLAVTSVSVFRDDSFLPEEINAEAVQSVISAARVTCPLLVHFKRDAEAFFLPDFNNVDVLAFQLDKYICITQQLCNGMSSKNTLEVIIHDISSLTFESNVNGFMIPAIDQLSRIRLDESFRMMFLFNTNAQNFIDTYSECQPRMVQFLSDLEETAVQLDKMKMGSSISTVAGSSVGIAGGVMSIVGLALAPVTAGVSLALTLTGVGLGVTSGVNSLVTGITEFAVNKHHGGNANNIFQSFMKDVEKILDCLEHTSSQCPDHHLDEGNIELGALKVICRTKIVAKNIKALVDGASATKALKSEEVARAAVNMGLQEGKAARNIPNLAADLPDIGQLAKGTPLALSKSVRAGLITANALFIGLDVFFICKEGMSLAKGEKSKISQIIRSRSALWLSEIEAWEKIHDSLCSGRETFQDNLKVLEQ